MLYYILFWTLLGFIIHFYIIFGTNLLTGGPAQIAVFCLFQSFAEKEYQMESKRNETFGSVIFETNVIQRTQSASQEAAEVATRVLGAPLGVRPLPRGPLVAPLTNLLCLNISTYPETIKEHHETLFPPPQPSVPVRSHLGAFFRSSVGGGIDPGGLLHQHHSLSDDV